MSVSDREADENSLFSGEMPSIIVQSRKLADLWNRVNEAKDMRRRCSYGYT